MQGFLICVDLDELVLYLTLPESSPKNAFGLNLRGTYRFDKSALGGKLNILLKVLSSTRIVVLANKIKCN